MDVAIALAGVAAYLLFVLPRLRVRAAMGSGFAFAAAGAAGWASGTTWLELPLAALGFGLLGWWVGRAAPVLRAAVVPIAATGPPDPGAPPGDHPTAPSADRTTLGRYHIEHQIGLRIEKFRAVDEG